MSGELLYLLISAVFLVLLWLFVFSVIWAVRSDLFGPKVKRMRGAAASAGSAPSASPAAAPVAPAASGRRAASAASTGTPAHLVFTAGPVRGRQLTLSQDALTFGRSVDSSVVLRDDYTSTHHARLSKRGDTWMVEDLGSTNGTMVGGQRISRPTPVGIGVPITIGTTVMELRG
ncbi:FHA domain-containing protein [Pseudoclavibacter sp. CFCC 13611]|uniref:FHA domain-containing protein FhaB/FipA n=1 Tax=Pseudoclavibacter sp. CFCC 13611 TaxID=2615178 RepID=UPI0013018564|nr:FHA domain-containing protein [Pseudoclavibacter sp. CFCC 13611]KAB1662933.1 FHA domain-containing protein [Pseudoclavibacter sp. CFCC 13611]